MLKIGTKKPAAAGLDETGFSSVQATVAVIIPTFNHARYLAEAIRSVLEQTCQADEILVVDDGSTDDPATVVAQFPKVRLIRQDNLGMSAARNAGVRNCEASYIVFLDADDRLLPTAIEAGLTCFESHPDCGFVYGGYRLISEDGRPFSSNIVRPIDGDPYIALLRRNMVGAIMSLFYRRDCLLAVNGFNETLRRSEDYDLHLRIAQRYPIASHPVIVSEYRKHDQAQSNNFAEMLRAVLMVLSFQEARVAVDPIGRSALEEGRAHYRNFYVSRMFDAASVRWRARHSLMVLAADLIQAARWSPIVTMRLLLGTLRRSAGRVLPRSVAQRIQRIRGRPYRIPVGSVHFGDLKRLMPISDHFGSDRGTPIDRYYIERFLAQNAADVGGRVLEADGNQYTLRFGNARVQRSDVLSIETTNPRATIVGDLERSATLPEAAFDCIILTQTLQFIFDVRAAIATLHAALKPGGVLLVTVPGVSKMRDSWPWYWTFTAAAVRRLLEDQFTHDAVSAETHGNIFSVTAMLHGIATEELDRCDLDAHDSDYPVIVAARAVKRRDA